MAGEHPVSPSEQRQRIEAACEREGFKLLDTLDELIVGPKSLSTESLNVLWVARRRGGGDYVNGTSVGPVATSELVPSRVSV
jgi:hypothetical protein